MLVSCECEKDRAGDTGYFRSEVSDESDKFVWFAPKKVDDRAYQARTLWYRARTMVGHAGCSGSRNGGACIGLAESQGSIAGVLRAVGRQDSRRANAGFPAPSPAPGRYIVYLPEVIRTPTDLRQTKASVWKDQNWYDQYQYTAKPGYWEVVLFAPDSNSKSQSGQDKHITEPLPGFQRTPILVAALLLVCYKMATGKDLLDGDRIRCPEQASKGRFAIMYFYEGSLLFNVDCFDHPYDRFWASAARRLSS